MMEYFNILILVLIIFFIFIALLCRNPNSSNSDNSDNSNNKKKEEYPRKENYPEGFRLTHKCNNFHADVNSDCLLIKSQRTGKWIKHKISDIVDAEIITDNNVVQKFSLTRAVAGGIIFGAVGGAIGGFSGQQERCKNMVLCIHFQNDRVFRYHLMMEETSVKTSSFLYKSSLQTGNNYIDFLRLIIKIVDRKNNK